MGHIRTLEEGDIASMTALFQRIFRDGDRPAPAPLTDFFRDTFLHHPWFDPEVASRVFVDAKDVVRGFIGVYPVPMEHEGQPLRAAIFGSLMADPDAGDPLIGAKLLRAAVRGPQDFSVSETANARSLAMWQRLKGESLTDYGMDWLRVLRPAGLGFQILNSSRLFTGLTRPVAAAGDSVARRLLGKYIGIDDGESRATDRDIDDAALIDALPEFTRPIPIHPDWDPPAIKWLLAYALDKPDYGEAVKRAVYGTNGDLIGLYIYHGRRGGLARVLQVLATPGKYGPVIDKLLRHADGMGCVAVTGKTHPLFLEALLHRRALLFRRSAMVVHSRSPDLLDVMRAGGLLATGPAGEGWSKLFGGRFD